MKKAILFIVPLVVVSLLASCEQKPDVIFTVNFDSDGGTSVTSQKVHQNKTAYEPTKPTKTSSIEHTFQFEEWQLNGVKYDFATPVTQDITLKAKWKENTQKYVVAFDSNGAETPVPAQFINYNERATDPGKVTRRDDTLYSFEFNYWHEVVDGKMKENPFDFGTPIDHDTILKVDWIKKNRFYKANAVDTQSLKFTTDIEAKNPLKNIDIPTNEPFTFYMTARDPIGIPSQFIAPTSLQITIGDRPRLTTGYTIKIDKTNNKKAAVTINADKIIGNVKIVGEAVKDGEFTYEVPYAFGLVPIDPGTHEKSSNLELTLKGKPGTSYGAPGANNIYVKFDNAGGEDPVQWVSPAEKLDEYCSYDVTIDGGKLTINTQHISRGITIIARSNNYKLLEDLDWKNDESKIDIDDISFSGLAPYVFYMGETKTVKVNGIDHQVRIIGFNHDVDPNNKPIGITFEFADTIYISPELQTTVWENKSGDLSTNRNFVHSNLNYYLNYNDNCVLSYLDTNLKDVIKTAFKKVGLQETYTTDLPYSAKLFPLSEVEMNGIWESVPEDEGTVYEFYKDKGDQDRIKKNPFDKSIDGYWLRSPHTEPTLKNDAWYVRSDGSIDHFSINNALNVAPAFCV